MPEVSLDLVSDIFSERGIDAACRIFVLNPLGDFACADPRIAGIAKEKGQIMNHERYDSLVQFFLQLLPRRFDLPEDKGQVAKKRRNEPASETAHLEGLKGLHIVTDEPLVESADDKKSYSEIFDELGLELEQEDGEGLPREKLGVRFDEMVTVSYIYSFRDLDEETRCAIWGSFDDIEQNACRNTKEFISDGGDWRLVTEEEDMVHDDVTGELFHPATWADIHFGGRKASGTKDKRGQKGSPSSSPRWSRGKSLSLVNYPRGLTSFA